jgi:hypothetical protein
LASGDDPLEAGANGTIRAGFSGRGFMIAHFRYMV